MITHGINILITNFEMIIDLTWWSLDDYTLLHSQPWMGNLILCFSCARWNISMTSKRVFFYVDYQRLTMTWFIDLGWSHLWIILDCFLLEIFIGQVCWRNWKRCGGKWSKVEDNGWEWMILDENWDDKTYTVKTSRGIHFISMQLYTYMLYRALSWQTGG